MIRFLERSASLVGLCMLALVIGCGGSSKKKVTCDGGPCADAGRDVSVKKDVIGDTVVTPDGRLPDVVLPDSGLPDTNPVQPEGGVIIDTLPADDVPQIPPDASPDTAGDTITSDVPPSDARIPDAGTAEAARDTLQADTLIVTPDSAVADAPFVTLDTAIPDADPDAGDDAPTNEDAEPDAGEDVAGDDVDADVDADIDAEQP